ncbi:MAG: hypothetical protein AB7Q17_08395 [Phycisphaerae bacterium]
MQFVKTHLISLACGVLALAFLGVAAVGMMRSQVQEAMNKRVQSAGEIQSLASKPQNEETIAAEKRRGELFQQEFEKTLEEANRINRRQPLMGGVFPKPASDATKFEFRDAYIAALRKLPPRLVAGDLPSAAEVAEEQQNVADLLQLEAESKAAAGEGDDKPAAAPAAPAPLAPPSAILSPAGMGVRGVGGGARSGGYSPGMMTGIPTSLEGEPKYNATYRAYVSKARSIRVYANEASFHISPIVEGPAAPDVESMWAAQVSYWVQQDIVEAIAKLNAAAAEKLGDADVYVEHVPVKRIDRLRVLGYVTKEGFLPFPAMNDAGQSTEVRQSFTGRTSDEQFDVVRLTLTVVVDQRDLLKLIDQIGKQNFYHCTHVDYSTVAPEPGYMYGTAPVVRATLDFEGYLARKAYTELMPPDVLVKLGGAPPGGG